MKGDTPFVITEWIWFKLQLRLYALESSAKLWVVRFNFDDEARRVTCAIWCKTTQQLIDKKADKAEQLSFYQNWVDVERTLIKGILDELPLLSKVFDTEHDLAFEILYDYGMGSSLVSEFKDGQFTWLHSE